MNILIDINHPAHVHFFKNAIKIFKKKGYNIFITARKKEITEYLLKTYDIKFTTISTMGKSIFSFFFELIEHEKKIYKILKKKRINLVLSIGGTFNVHACKLLRIPSFVFTGTENAKLQNAITFPFCDKILTSFSYRDDLGKKHIKYNSYGEIAYLYPKYFNPNPSILNLLGIKQDEKYTIIRFVSWGASHDIGHTGLSLDMKIKAVKEFSKYGKVFITSEGRMPNELERYRVKIPPERMHDALYYSTLLYGESATMASECAILGTPAIYLDNDGRGFTDDEEKRYGSVFNFTESREDQEKSIMKGIDILCLDRKEIKNKWAEKSRKILEENIDLTQWIIDFIEKSIVSKD